MACQRNRVLLNIMKIKYIFSRSLFVYCCKKIFGSKHFYSIYNVDKTQVNKVFEKSYKYLDVIIVQLDFNY